MKHAGDFIMTLQNVLMYYYSHFIIVKCSVTVTPQLFCFLEDTDI